MSWRRDEGRYDRWNEDSRYERPRSPMWDLRRSVSPECRPSPQRDRYTRDRFERRDRYERDQDRHRASRDRHDRFHERDRDRERRRSPRHYDEDNIPTAPSPPRISHDSKVKSRSRSRSKDRSKSTDVITEDDQLDTQNKQDQDSNQILGQNVSPGDWHCSKCGSYNFKRRFLCYRRTCSGKRSEGIIYEGDAANGGSDSKPGITKCLLFRRLDALTTEEGILEALKGRCSKEVIDSIAGITAGKETLTGASKCLAYINFISIADSTAAYTELTNLQPPLVIDNREVLISYYNQQTKSSKNVDYPMYYPPATSYNTNTQALSEADRVNAAAAVAQSAISAAQARQMTWIPMSAPTFVASASQVASNVKVPTGDGKTVYSAPDTRTFLYDETSGYYYDPSTGLYYDGNTQYFFNNQIFQYMYWDATTSTYIAATQHQQNTDQPKLPNPPQITDDNTVTKEPEEKKKRDKDDKVKVAKKIAKDMERWARTLNQKKEYARSNIVMEQPLDTSASKGSADIGFSVLGAGPSLSLVREISPPPTTEEFLVKKVPEPDYDNDEGIIDWSKLTCLLCKRRFPSVDVLTKHKTMSELHKQNLVEYQKKNDLLPQMNGYRDRAAERRMKFGEDDTPVPRKRFELQDMPPPSLSHPPPSVVDTIGGKMLQKMGWSQGRGLGKEEQGRIAPIEAEQRPGLAGLGQKRGIYTPTPGETYRDTVKKLMIARYKEVVGQEEDK